MVANVFSLGTMSFTRGVTVFALLLFRVLARSVAAAAYADSSAVVSTVQHLVENSHDYNNGDGDVAAAHVMDDIMTQQLSTRTAFYSSPKCWLASISKISQLTIDNGGDSTKQLHSSGSSYCASMTDEQQELLALELTNCQLVKEKRPFFDASRAENQPMEVVGCMVGRGGTSPYDASSCFPLMTEYALSLYHKILLHTNEVCTRLTEERMMIQKEEITQMLVYASSAASQQMQSVLDGASAVMEKMQVQSAMLDNQSMAMMEQREELQRMYLEQKNEEREKLAMVKQGKTLLEEQYSMMRDQQLESARLQKAHEEAAALAVEQMSNQTASFMQEQAEKMRSHQSDLEVALQNREREAALFVERVQMETTNLIAEQVDKIKEQKRDLERMEEMIANANSQIQPLSSIESYVKLATSGFTIMKALLNFVLSVNIAWFVTTVPLLCKARRYLCGIFTLGLIVEGAVFWLNGNMILDNYGMDLIAMIRFWSRALAVMTTLLHLLASCFWPPERKHPAITMDELLKNQMEFVSKLNSPAQLRTIEERIEASPVIAAENPKPPAVKFNEERGRSVARIRLEDSFIISNRNFKPGRRRSRSPHRSSLTELAMPVVTPLKPRARSSVVAPPPSHEDSQTTYYAHRSDAIAKQEKESHRAELECLRALQKRYGDESCTTSSDESSAVRSYGQRNRKRKLYEAYESSSEESQHFFSADDEDMSVSTSPCDASSLDIQEKKKSKLSTTH